MHVNYRLDSQIEDRSPASAVAVAPGATSIGSASDPEAAGSPSTGTPEPGVVGCHERAS